MAISPKDRRDRADATTRTARAESDAGLQAQRKKTARLRAERLAREAELQASMPPDAPAPAKKSRTAKTAPKRA